MMSMDKQTYQIEIIMKEIAGESCGNKKRFVIKAKIHFMHDQCVDKYFCKFYAMKLDGEKQVFQGKFDKVWETTIDTNLFLERGRYLCITCEALVYSDSYKFVNVNEKCFGGPSKLSDEELFNPETIGIWGFCKKTTNFTFKFRYLLDEIRSKCSMTYKVNPREASDDLEFQLRLSMESGWEKKSWKGPHLIQFIPPENLLAFYEFYWKVWLLDKQMNLIRCDKHHNNEDIIILKTSDHKWKKFNHVDGSFKFVVQLVTTKIKELPQTGYDTNESIIYDELNLSMIERKRLNGSLNNKSAPKIKKMRFLSLHNN